MCHEILPLAQINHRQCEEHLKDDTDYECRSDQKRRQIFKAKRKQEETPLFETADEEVVGRKAKRQKPSETDFINKISKNVL